MPYLTLGTTSQLQIKVPTNGTTDWGDTLKTDTFQKIAEHDHTGSGRGSKLGTGSILDDAITEAKILIGNNAYIPIRNAADSADLNSMKANASNQLEFGTDVAVFNLVNDTYLTSDNAGGTPTNLLKLSALDKIVFGSTIASGTFDLLTGKQVNAAGSVTLTDNTSSAADASIISLSADETARVEVKVTRNGAVRRYTLEMDEDNSGLVQSWQGDDVGVTWSIDAGVLKYVTTSTGFNATATYTIIKE